MVLKQLCFEKCQKRIFILMESSDAQGQTESYSDEVVAMDTPQRSNAQAPKLGNNGLESAKVYDLSPEEDGSDNETPPLFEINKQQYDNIDNSTIEINTGIPSNITEESDKKKANVSEVASPIMQECIVCMEEILKSNMFCVDCENAHRFCFPCIRRHVTIALKEKKIASCIMCSHELTQVSY